MTHAFTPAARVVYRPHGFFATYLGPGPGGTALIRYDNATEATVHPATLDLWPYKVVLIPRSEIRRIYQDHGSPSFPQVDGDGVMDADVVSMFAKTSRELAEDSDNALRLIYIAEDLEELVVRHEQRAGLADASR